MGRIFLDNFKGEREVRIYELAVTLFAITVFAFSCYVYHLKEDVYQGLINIISSPAALITDFLVIGGIGAGFLNAILIFFFNLFLIRMLKIKINGLILALLFTTFGFCFFGKNILNILPIYVGGILYSKYEDISFKDAFVPITFATALAPFISEIAFRTNTYEFSYLNAVTLGIIIGFIVTPLAKKMKGFHEGYNLYNLGFTAGVLGAVFNSILKTYGFEVASRRILSTQFDPALKIICSSIFLLLIINGFFINDCSFKDFKKLCKDNGLESDFVEKYGFGLTFINMGIMGFVAILFPTILGETLNGPMLAGVFTIVGFSAHGKTCFNTIPILLGILFAGYTNVNDDYFTIVLSGLFATSLAPITGVFGIFWGFVAGWLHMAVVSSIGVLHGGMNLYNNGFAAGIVAGFMLPIVRTVNAQAAKREMKFLKKRKEIISIIEKHKLKGSE